MPLFLPLQSTVSFIKHAWNFIPDVPQDCFCWTCEIKIHGMFAILYNIVRFLRSKNHRRIVAQGLESCPCVGRDPRDPRRSYCTYSDGYPPIRELCISDEILCDLCSNLARELSNTGNIMSETGLSFVSSKRQIFRTADKGCPLCRVLLDRFIADHDPYFGALSNLPFLGRITFCLRAVDGEIGSYSSENRSKFNVLQIAFLEDKVLQPESKRWLRKVRWWRKGQVLERFIHLEFFTIAAEAGSLCFFT